MFFFTNLNLIKMIGEIRKKRITFAQNLKIKKWLRTEHLQ